MRIVSSSSLLAAAALISAPALAQTAPQAKPDPAPAPAAAPAAAPATVSDEEVAKFTTAAIAVEKLSKDAAVADADKQTKMAASVQASGLEPARFNTIAQALQTDPALKARVQAEYAKQVPAK